MTLDDAEVRQAVCDYLAVRGLRVVQGAPAVRLKHESNTLGTWYSAECALEDEALPPAQQGPYR